MDKNQSSAAQWYFFIPTSNWQIKKFADKLKDYVCMLIGCTREQLEDQTFKNTPLGEQWWYYSFGNGTVKIDYTVADYTDKQREDYSIYLVKPTPRLLLQLVGTEGGRDLIHPNVWVNSLFADYKETEDYVGGSGHTSYPTHSYPNWLITDMRFPNEMQAVKDRGGITIRVTRDIYNYLPETQEHEWRDAKDDSAKIARLKTRTYSFQESYKMWMRERFNPEEHASENAVDQEDFDYLILNDGTIKDLAIKVGSILQKESIISVDFDYNFNRP